jgi:hypothetical protein
MAEGDGKREREKERKREGTAQYVQYIISTPPIFND